ncbi:MAG TPA: polysaccharide biosynthesis tyrosine autokinase [Geminicoccaceae bacterium]
MPERRGLAVTGGSATPEGRVVDLVEEGLGPDAPADQARSAGPRDQHGRHLPHHAAPVPEDDDQDVHRFRAWLPAGAAQGVELDEVLRRLRRRSWLIAGIALLGSLLALVVVLQLQPRYLATAKVIIDPRTSNVLDIRDIMPSLPTDPEAIESEIQVITSRRLAGRTVERLDLEQKPAFNEALQEPGWLSRALDGTGPALASWLGWPWAEWLPGAGPDDQSGADAARARAKLINGFLDRLKVEQEGRSRVISISFQSPDPDLAAQVANTHAELYLLEQLETKFEATERATRWLEERLTELRETVRESENAVEAYRREAGLVQSDDITLVGQRLVELNTRLASARAERAAAENRLRQVEEMSGTPGALESIPEVIADLAIGRLRQEESGLRQQIAELANDLGDRHPRMVSLNSELASVRSKIDAEIQRSIATLRNEANRARSREAALQANVRELEEEAASASARQVRLRALQREADANRALLETFLTRFKEASGEQELQEPDARIISAADPPLDPAFPRKKLVMVVAFVGSLGLGALLALLLEHFDRGIRSSEQVEGLTGLKTLALLPKVRWPRGRTADPARYVLEKPASAYAEAVRSLYTGLARPCRSVLVTSCEPEEGKTTVALSLARVLAMDGRSVALVDADLRRARVASALGMQERRVGLSDVLAGRLPVDAALQTDPASPLRVLTAGRSTRVPQRIPSEAALAPIIRHLRNSHDIVIIDSPPVLAVADARLIVPLVDTVVYVVRWGVTPRKAALLGLRQLEAAGANIGGVVLSRVDQRQHASYDFADSGLYQKKNLRYYAD